METVKCGRCQGEGFQAWEEDDRPVQDVCYRCGGTGRISEESARGLRLEQVANILACHTVEAMIKAYNEDPDGEGWEFRAAESMMSVRDYTTMRTMDYAEQHGEEISKLSEELQDALILALLPRPPEEVKPAPVPPPAPSAAGADENDIPF